MNYKFKLGTIIADDIDKSIDFYQNVLGFKLIRKFYQEEGGLCLLKSPDGASIELIDSKAFPTGFWSLGMEVDDFEAAINDLREKGMSFIYGPEELPLGKLAGIEDPNGVKIMVLSLNDD
ncbi:MAG: VOC family protein [Firmicutes bacterium]|nr:VOC family protein [Bacillota bacterium]